MEINAEVCEHATAKTKRLETLASMAGVTLPTDEEWEEKFKQVDGNTPKFDGVFLGNNSRATMMAWIEYAILCGDEYAAAHLMHEMGFELHNSVVQELIPNDDYFAGVARRHDPKIDVIHVTIRPGYIEPGYVLQERKGLFHNFYKVDLESSKKILWVKASIFDSEPTVILQ